MYFLSSLTDRLFEQLTQASFYDTGVVVLHFQDGRKAKYSVENVMGFEFIPYPPGLKAEDIINLTIEDDAEDSMPCSDFKWCYFTP